MPDLHGQLRILIVRLGAMGDILHALPAVAALRAAHSEWYLGWAIEPRWRALLCADSRIQDRQSEDRQSGNCGNDSAMPLVDRVHSVSAKQWIRNPYRASTVSELMAMRRELREEHYDVALDLQGAVRSALVAQWSNAPRRIGEAAPREYPARFLFNQRVATHAIHVIDQACEVASSVVHDSLKAVPPCLPYDERDEAWCDTYCGRFVPPDFGGRFVLVNPGAGWGAKRWPVERYGQLAAMLYELRYAVVINTGPNEKILADAVIKASGDTAVSMSCTLGELIGMTRRASLVIAGDTGPLHLASTLARPVVGIFGPTDPARNGPYQFNGGSTYRVLRSPESRRDHTRHVEPESGLLTITTQEVFAAAVDLLPKNRGARMMPNGQ